MTPPRATIALMTCALPTDLADRVARLLAVRQATAAAKANHAISARRLQDLAGLAPPLLATQAASLIASLRLADRVRLPFNLIVSNVPGTKDTLSCGGRRIMALYPLPALGNGVGLNITVNNYGPTAHRHRDLSGYRLRPVGAAALDDRGLPPADPTRRSNRYLSSFAIASVATRMALGSREPGSRRNAR